jgi:phosphoribosylanthranilate isomerase
MATRIKICGITRAEDGLAAAQSGAHAIGLMFYEKSPRFVTLEKAREIIAALPLFVARVGVFVNPAAVQVRNVLEALRLDLLQFHGDEAPEFSRQFGLPYIKAVQVKQDVDLVQYASRYREAKGLLLDTHSEGVYGGTGKSFDWRLIPPTLPLAVILSGGLNERNVAAAVRQVKPWAVDVSSGVESAKGIKDAAKIAAFITEVKNADV